MPTADALTGLGMPAQQAAQLGGNPFALTTKGTTQTAAAVILSKNTELVTGASQTGAIFPATSGIMEPHYITNAQSVAGLVYVPVGHTLNSVTTGGVNGHVSVATGTSVIMWQYRPKFWAAILSAVV